MAARGTYEDIVLIGVELPDCVETTVYGFAGLTRGHSYLRVADGISNGKLYQKHKHFVNEETK